MQHLYVQKTIPKPDGTLRHLQVPCTDLKHLQKKYLRLLKDHINLEAYPIYGLGGAGRSAQAHAAQHLGKNVVVKMDIKKFFPNTKPYHLDIATETLVDVADPYISHLQKNKWLVFFLTQKPEYDHLPTGAPTSPWISSFCFLPADDLLIELANSHNMTYTRYIDDLIFSGDSYPAGLQKEVCAIVKKFNYTINHKKSQVLYAGNHTQNITGVATNSKEPRITREYRRELRTALNTFAKYGVPLTDKYQGRLAYVRQVNPLQYTQLMQYYHKRIYRWQDETSNGLENLHTV